MKKYDVTFKSTNGEETINNDYYVSFQRVPGQYGNGTYMKVESKKKGYADWLYDIRYDTNYRKDAQMEYILRWIRTQWSGEEGSYRAKEISIREVE